MLSDFLKSCIPPPPPPPLIVDEPEDDEPAPEKIIVGLSVLFVISKLFVALEIGTTAPDYLKTPDIILNASI